MLAVIADTHACERRGRSHISADRPAICLYTWCTNPTICTARSLTLCRQATNATLLLIKCHKLQRKHARVRLLHTGLTCMLASRHKHRSKLIDKSHCSYKVVVPCVSMLTLGLPCLPQTEFKATSLSESKAGPPTYSFATALRSKLRLLGHEPCLADANAPRQCLIIQALITSAAPTIVPCYWCVLGKA